MQPGRSSFRPRVECLEDRTLMTAQITATLEGGVLRIVGNNKNDNIVVQQKNNQISITGIDIRVRGRSPVASVRASDVKQIQVLGGAGNDTIVLGGSATSGPNALVKPTVIWAGSGNTTIWGDTGQNTIYTQTGNDVVWSRGLHDVIHLGSGHNTVHYTRVSAPLSTTDTQTANSHNVKTAAVPASAPVDPFQAQVNQLIGMINSYRVSNGLKALTVDSRLVAAATYQADYMARTGDYSHVDLDGRTVGDRLDAAGYPFSFVGENIHLYDPTIQRTEGIDRIYPESQLVEYFFDGWQVSPPHNENMLAPQVKNIGIAFAEDSAGRIYACADFATT
jgi:uncharacterized protein YkwD